MKRVFIVACSSALIAWAAPAQAFENFLKIDGIDGESTQVDHRDWIDIGAWSWGVSNVGSGSAGGGAGVGKAVFKDFTWSQMLDTSVVPIFLGVANGQHYQDATLDVARSSARNSSFFQMIFTDVTLHSLQLVGLNTSNDVTGALGYSAVKMRYRPQDASGRPGAWIEGSFSLKDNKLLFSGDANVIQGLLAAGGQVSLDAPIGQVPEPASWLLMGSAALMLVVARRRR